MQKIMVLSEGVSPCDGGGIWQNHYRRDAGNDDPRLLRHDEPPLSDEGRSCGGINLMMICAPKVTYRAAKTWQALLSARSLVIPLTFRDHA
jgi:hypothetical protein